jgi:hypothetical protein
MLPLPPMLRIALFLLITSTAVAQTTLNGKQLPIPKASENTLFYLQRSKNTNTVMYEAKVDQTGKLMPDTPISAYWLDYELGENIKSDLSYMERTAVYGVDSEELKDGKGSYVMRLKAFKDRAVTVAKNQLGKYEGLMTINGRKAILKRIYIEAKEGLFTPSVVHVDLFGIDPVTGESVFERIIP